MDSPFVPKEVTSSTVKPYIIYVVAYIIFLGCSIYVTARGKYAVNIIGSACLVVFYIITVNFIGFEWLK